MIHENRRWCLQTVGSAEELARKLTQQGWTLCCGFEIGKYLFLNNAFSEDGAQEYAVVRKPVQPGEPYLQVESITMSWASEANALAYIQQALAGEMDKNDFATPVEPRLETPEQHRRCHLCA